MKKYKKFLFLIVFTMGSQSLIYFSLKLFLSDFNIIDSIIDVPLIKSFVYFYDIWYPFILINAALIYTFNKSSFKYLIVSLLLAAFFGHITFIIYPSMVIRPIIEVNNLTDWALNMTYISDTPAVNCLPSIHCIYCFVTSFYIFKSKNIKLNYRLILVTLSLLIAISTVLIKQHIIEDVILSLIYSIIAIIIVYLSREKIANLFKKYDL